MRGHSVIFLSSIWTLFFTASRFRRAAAYVPSNFFPQSFEFDWNPPGTALPTPVTQLCQTLQISWERGSDGSGPNPTSPYFLQVFASNYTVPFVVPAGSGSFFEYQVPFPIGTQYQICMTDSKGLSGGCQDIYTVIPNSSFTLQNQPNCTSPTLPSTPLQVNAQVNTGAFAQYGWIPQCTDIQVQGVNGTGPYTLTVAPTLHPPLNITSDSGPINWTVAFTHGFPFFIAVTDSQGNSWSQGPLHAGDNTDTTCLDTARLESSPSGHKSSSTVPASVGAGVGGLVLGLLAGTFGILAFMRSRRGSKGHRGDLIGDSQLSSGNSQSREMPTPGISTNVATGGMEYVVEPFAMPSATPMSPPGGQSDPLLHRGGVTSPTIMSRADAMSAAGSSEPAESSSGRRATRNVYVVHHDGGQAPVSVYTDEGADVVELPPRYAAGGSTPSETSSTDVNRRNNSTRKKRESPRV